MKIVIIGLGTIGRTVLKSLSGMDHTITIIDDDKEKVESLIEKYDVFGVVGNGACLDIQREANMGDADLAIVLTNSDELNVFACLVAKRVGVKNTVARVRNPDYSMQIMEMKDELGISMIVNPEKETAEEIFNLINLPSVSQMEHFAKGRVLLAEIIVDKSCALVGETLISLGKKLNNKVLVCAVQRGDEVVIPSGNFMFQVGDRVHFTSDANTLRNFLSEVNLEKSPFKDIRPSPVLYTPGVLYEISPLSCVGASVNSIFERLANSMGFSKLMSSVLLTSDSTVPITDFASTMNLP